MSDKDKKISRIITAVALIQMIAALGILVVGVLQKRMTNLQSNLLMGGTLLVYWILMDIAEPVFAHRLRDATPEQKNAYPKYIILDFVGYAGIAYFLLGMGSSQSNSIIGALIYGISIKPKQENQKIFLGQKLPEQDECAEEAEETAGGNLEEKAPAGIEEAEVSAEEEKMEV